MPRPHLPIEPHRRLVRLIGCLIVLLVATNTQASNLVLNGEFDVDDDGWGFLGTGGLNVSIWDPADWRGAPLSGSWKLTNRADASAGTVSVSLFQCRPAPIVSHVRVAGWLDVPRVQGNATADGGLFIRFWTGNDCFSGTQTVSGATPRPTPVNGPWMRAEGFAEVPADAQWMEIHFILYKLSGAAGDLVSGLVDGIVVEPVGAPWDLGTTVVLSGEVTSVWDQSGSLPGSVNVGEPARARIDFDEAGTGLSYLMDFNGFLVHVEDGFFRSQHGSPDDLVSIHYNTPAENPIDAQLATASLTLEAADPWLPELPFSFNSSSLRLLLTAEEMLATIFGSAATPQPNGLQVIASFDQVQLVRRTVFADSFELGTLERWLP